ncbi:DNA-binding protein [Crateriforma conspicua]|uniref:DNA-binding protein n=1 Tax=Crateriforma conspicua TaxID=2527996 RepID=A0A5C5Y9P4_9PLAN|nr:DNA-binding protein [Crateriforma conspicua]TWT71649.1 hypothetical protein Pan14r_39590 [Crateriforma conspicua]
MANDLTASSVQRQNILNNPFAVTEIQKATSLRGVSFEGETWLVKEQVADFFEVDVRTIERILEQNRDELSENGYAVIRGKRLQALKLAISEGGGTDIDVGTKVTVLGIFSFRAFLNLGMLLTDSQRAILLRKLVLDIAIDVINQRTGGGTKYINQRDQDFIHAWFQEENFRKELTDALRDCVAMGNFKYAIYTDKIYQSIFRERTAEYRKILKLEKADKTRATFYSEVLDLIASYERGFAHELRDACERKGEPLTTHEVDELFTRFESMPLWKPLIDSARNKMASRDLAFRDALHQQLEEYVTPIEAADFERFLGEKSMELQERLEQAKDVFKRLKERE